VKNKDAFHGITGGIILIGIGIIFLANIEFFPAILVVIGLAGLPESVAQKGFWAGIQSAVWLIGIAVLFTFDIFWPGILILIGLSMVAGALVRPPGMEGKRKRGLPLPSEADDEDADDYDYEYEDQHQKSKRV
jgi:predicted membrane protein